MQVAFERDLESKCVDCALTTNQASRDSGARDAGGQASLHHYLLD